VWWTEWKRAQSIFSTRVGDRWEDPAVDRVCEACSVRRRQERARYYAFDGLGLACEACMEWIEGAVGTGGFDGLMTEQALLWFEEQAVVV